MELNLIMGSFLFSVLNSHYIPSTHLRTDGQVSVDNSESSSTFAVVVEQEQAIFFFPSSTKGGFLNYLNVIGTLMVHTHTPRVYKNENT